MLRSSAFVFVLAAIVVASASATESTIFPGVGIGKVKLGMTRAQVERALGKDFLVNRRASIGGSQYMELGWNFSSWSVGFLKSGRTYRVSQVGTTLWAQRTTKGIGPGTLWRKLVRTYPGGLCTTDGNSLALPGQNIIGGYLEYLVPRKGGTQTIYMLQGLYEDKADPTKVTHYRVFEVHVRTPFYRLPEFAPDFPYRCAPGWQSTDTPEHVLKP